MSISLPNDITVRDASQWLQECFCYIGNTIAYFAGSVRGERHGSGDEDRERGRAISAVFHTSDDRERRVEMSEVRCHWPVCGAINRTQNGVNVAVYVERLQRKQYRRSFNRSCVAVTVPASWGVVKRFGQGGLDMLQHWGFEFAKDLFEPVYYTVEQALEMIQNGAVSVAISPQVTLCGDGKGQYAVYYRKLQVGGYYAGVFTPSVQGYPAQRASHILRGITTNGY